MANSALVPSLATFNTPGVLLALFGLFLMAVLVIRGTKGAIFISIVLTTLLSVVLALLGRDTNSAIQTALQSGSLELPRLSHIFAELKFTFGAAL